MAGDSLICRGEKVTNQMCGLSAGIELVHYGKENTTMEGQIKTSRNSAIKARSPQEMSEDPVARTDLDGRCNM
jgi:hypothetical protein